MRAVTFRQSCVYGTRQFGVEDQGWVAWFTIAASLGQPVTIYGDGRQIRDVLHVKDLARAYEAAIERADEVAGQAFNMGGGPDRTLSLLELVGLLESRLGHPVQHSFGDWRPGDQKVFVCDVRKAERMLGWRPQIDVETGVTELIDWVGENGNLFGSIVDA